MEKLSEAIKDYTTMEVGHEALQDAAKEWAAYCLSTYTGDLLSKGLAISSALANFTAELEDRK